MRTPLQQRRVTLLALRKRINPARRFKVEYLGGDHKDGITFRFTCTTCGASFEEEQRYKTTGRPAGLFGHTPPAMQRMANYQNGNRTDGSEGHGIQGHCKRCTKRARDERHPLPKQEA